MSPQGNGGTAAPASAEEGQEDFVGGTYVRFDAPKAKMRKSWPGVRGTPCFNLLLSPFNYPLTNKSPGGIYWKASEFNCESSDF